jgi:glucuronoarabinoxylan endo-1,4-beta-xylanase
MTATTPSTFAGLHGTVAILVILPTFACGGTDDGRGGPIEVTAPNVRQSQPVQTIDGFGVNTAWLGAPTDATARQQVYDALFSVSQGIGLSMVRHRIPFRENPEYDDKFVRKNPDGSYQSTTNADGSKSFALDWSNWDLRNTAEIIADLKKLGPDYQLTKIISAPWTPPNNSVSKWKVPDNTTASIDYVDAPEVGGSLDPAFYADYADLLADYALGFSANMGTELTALSLQNEPNFKCDYESANWTAAQLHDFMVALEVEFTKKGVFTRLPELKIIAPEYQNVKEDLVLPTLADPKTAAVLGILGVHQYEYGKGRTDGYAVPIMSQALAAGKPVWMTEWSSAEWGADSSMANGLLLANLIHMDLTVGQMNAFLYWWGWGDGTNTLLVVDTTTWEVGVPKRAYVLGNWSRFVRPGYVRIDTDAKPGRDVLLSAFKSPTGDRIVVVAVNASDREVSLPLWLDVGAFGPLAVYRTSASADENLAHVGTIDGGSMVTVTLPPASVSTFVSGT